MGFTINTIALQSTKPFISRLVVSEDPVFHLGLTVKRCFESDWKGSCTLQNNVAHLSNCNTPTSSMECDVDKFIHSTKLMELFDTNLALFKIENVHEL